MQDSLSSWCLASSWSLMGTGELTEQPDEMLSKGLGGGRGGGTCHGRAFRPRGELQYFLSLHATETRILCCWIGIVARVQIYLYALNKKINSAQKAWIEATKVSFFFFNLRFRPKNSNIALSMFPVFTWSFITTLIQSICSLRKLSVNNFKMSCF